MNIPKGYKLVPVEPTDHQMKIARSMTLQQEQTVGAEYRAMVKGAPTPPQPIYDEAAERELFEAFYSERAKTLPLPLGNPIRYGGGQYVNDFALFGWMVWLACAQSRAKSVEVGDSVGRVSLSDKALSLIDEEIRIKGLPS